jgi:hypothetical protein
MRLLELDDDGLLILIELLDGLRALEVTPDRIVGRLTVVLLDWLLVLLLLGMRMLNLLVDLLELLLRGALLLEEILLRPEDLGVTVLVGVLLIDREREEVADREELALAEEDCRLLEAEEDLEDWRLLELLWLELLLLLDDFSAKTGLMVSIKAKNNIPTTILTFFRDFIVAIILLLKYLT